MQAVKYGNDKPLRWKLNRDPAGFTTITVRFAKNPGDAAVVEKTATQDGDPADWIILITLEAADFGEGKLEVGDWLVDVVTTDSEGNVLTHPDDADKPHEKLKVLAALGPEEG